MYVWKALSLLASICFLVLAGRYSLEEVIVREFCRDFRNESSSINGASQESVEVFELDPSRGLLSEPGSSFAILVSDEIVGEISGSVLRAETWLRNHVLSRYPAENITTIVVSGYGSCQNDQERNVGGVVLSSLKNIHYSLTRWGLDREIKVSPAFSPSCLLPTSPLFEDTMFEIVIKPMFRFLQSINSTYSLDQPRDFSFISKNALDLLLENTLFLNEIESLSFNKVNILLNRARKQRHTSRKLISYTDDKVIDPYPARPSPLPKVSPIHSSIGYSAPATVAKSPNYYPQPGVIPPSPLSIPVDSPPPFSSPPIAHPPMIYPPCSPTYSTAPAVSPASKGVLWCVAKPTVPDETLQEGMDFACGEGGGDCDEIMPNGNCFNPDTVVAHASYAFNSYWQKNKGNGGTCNFGGTAMLINSDPSFLNCRFVLA